MIKNYNLSLAHHTIKSYLKNIPLQYSDRLSKKYGAEVFFKREDLQPTRSFKIRGSLYKILKEYKNNPDISVVCASAGNHAQGVAFSSHLLDIPGNIFVPETTPQQKKNRIQYFGNQNINLIVEGQNFNEALESATKFASQHNHTFIHPYDDTDIILGQATIGYEIRKELEPDIVISCVGGGGLISGLVTSLSPETTIIGAEPKGANSMWIAMLKGRPYQLKKIDTFVDGASVDKMGKHNFDICYPLFSQGNNIKLISNEHICHELINSYQDDGIILEPAGVLSICALDKIPREQIKNKKIVCILSGGNNDVTRYPEIMEKNLLYLDRKHYYIIEFPQKPKQLKKFILSVLGENDDITRFEYIKKTNTSFGNVLVGLDTQYHKVIEEKMKQNNFKFCKISEDDLIYSYLI